jgi:cytidylate kinase
LRLSKKFVTIAIFGKSCTGKSTVADELGKLLRIQVRHCGEILKSRALLMRTPVSGLSLEVHKSIDAETRAWATEPALKIVEGIFLDEVLRGLNEVLFVRLVCDTEVRGERLQLRRGASSSIQTRDEEDEELRRKLYPESTPPLAITDNLNINTDKEPPATIVRMIIEAMAEDLP